MTPTELELSKSSVNCLPRGVPAIWLQNPYTTMIVHKPGLMVQLYEVLNNWRIVHLDGRPLPKYPEPFFHGNSTAQVGGRHAGGRIHRIRRADLHPAEWLVPQRRAEGHRALHPPVDELPDCRDHGRRSEGAARSRGSRRHRRWTLGDGEIYEFYCTNNKELEELQKLREHELQQKK